MTNSFVIRQNIIRYLQLLQHETDLERKRVLLRLLGEEQAKSRGDPPVVFEKISDGEPSVPR